MFCFQFLTLDCKLTIECVSRSGKEMTFKRQLPPHPPPNISFSLSQPAMRISSRTSLLAPIKLMVAVPHVCFAQAEAGLLRAVLCTWAFCSRTALVAPYQLPPWGRQTLHTVVRFDGQKWIVIQAQFGILEIGFQSPAAFTDFEWAAVSVLWISHLRN